MKTIELKTITVSGNPEDQRELDYLEVIRGIANAPGDPQTPVRLDEQRRRLRILDALDAVKPTPKTGKRTLKLEDADAKVLADLVEKFPWGMVGRGIVTFCDDVIGACRGGK